jgi:nucleotide-binding universal stress UspA family protein
VVEQPEAPRARPLRILLAHDLSPASDLAVGLIAHASWPATSVVRVITSRMGVGPSMSSFANLREARIHAHQVRVAIASTHERVAAELREAGVATESRTVRGKPEQAIVAEADRFGADLVVVGARRQGSIAATLLGSVSRAVVERASCSVLIARSTAIRRVLLATDGSLPARLATTIVGTWPMFAGARILLVGVGEGPPLYPGVVLNDSERDSAYRDTVVTSADEATSAVDEAVADLAARGRDVQAEIRVGEAATEVVSAAREWPADVVVQGAYAKPLLHRLILGSVARKVLDGVTCSVLVARPGPTSDPAHTVR